MKEIQLTAGGYGHTLNATQVFSPDGQWLVYDTRNEDAHISRTGEIEKVNVNTGEVIRLYSTSNQTVYGPGVGAAAWNPVSDSIIFIHGLLHCTPENPYGFTRRFGALIDAAHPSTMQHADARAVREPLIPGALRGGTHAHTWSGDGKWISFTYNDAIMESLEKSHGGNFHDLRTIGAMAPVRKVVVTEEDDDNFSGSYFTTVTATVGDSPLPGSDQIERAFDECWIGIDGYRRKDGTRQQRAIAFQGNVHAKDGTIMTEVFVADIPADITRADGDQPLQGTVVTRPSVPKGLVQRRISHTLERKHPGLQGPRVRLRTSPDGSIIYFPMKDDSGIVQIYTIPTVGGQERQLTYLNESLQAQFNVSPDGQQLSIIAGDRIWLVNSIDGQATAVTEKREHMEAPVGGALWSPSSKVLVYNRYVLSGDKYFLQVFKIELTR